MLGNLVQDTWSLRSLSAAACMPYRPETIAISNKQLQSSCLMTYFTADAVAK